ncbi:MAG: ribonucleotide reductase subunit alpha [Proteobacteria bacterium]|nr:ribonucleotide reductase subunit alpha [Pseudomonadota bacterium]
MTATDALSDFHDLLQAAQRQPQPQRLLFVFARREIDHHATPLQRERFAAGHGGYLQPALCVDKLPAEVTSFAALVAESQTTGKHWDVVFVGGLEGRGGVAPNADEAAQPLRFMVNAINEGRIASFAAFDRTGQPLTFV